MTLGEKLRKARTEKGMTQAEVAGERITRNMLSQIENDVASPSVGTLEYLAARLGVRAGWLFEDAQTGGAAQKLPRARQLLQQQNWRECLDAAQALEGDEALAIQAMAAAHLARAALDDEAFSDARAYAERALESSGRGLYRSQALQLSMAAVLARCAQQAGQDVEQAVGEYRRIYLEVQNGVEYHLLMARYQLEQEHIQAAEREIWSIVDLPEKSRAEYLVLRGRIAAKKEQYENAALYLQQAEELGGLSRILRRELYRCMELCCRETEDYKQAYEYAAKQIALSEA